MARLTSPETGVTVSVADDYAKELQSQGWKPAASSKPQAKTSSRSTGDK